MLNSSIFTYQTRLQNLSIEEIATLDKYCALQSKIERKLYAKIKTNPSNRNEIKRQLIEQFGISGRMFNSIAMTLDGKTKSIKELLPGYIDKAKSDIAKKEMQISKVLAKKSLNKKQLFSLHQMQRRLAILHLRLDRLTKQKEAKDYAICFGTRKLFHAQYNLEAHGYASHQEWQTAWRAERSKQFFVVGSKDESAGNMLCQLSEQGDTLTMKLRLPDSLNLGKHLNISKIDFQYGKDQIQKALRSSHRKQREDGKGTVRDGTALSYRFVKDKKGYRLFVSVDVTAPELLTNRNLGAIGIDLNADHLAVSEIDYRGNWIFSQRHDLPILGKTSHQASAMIGDEVAKMIELATMSCKPIVIEKLDFQKKKRDFNQYNPTGARMLSSLAYNKILQTIKAAAFRAGVEVIEVNPAYTSVIGQVNYAQVYGLSIHLASAIAIARRGLGFSEKLASRNGLVPIRNGSHLTFSLPVRNRKKHVWNHWQAIRKSVTAAHKAHARLGLSKTNPKPLRSIRPLGSSYCVLGTQFPYASRSLLLDGDIDSTIPY
ncbi:IS200/IS605 family accessory protein TnpB-related protein [Polynucleobacter kasalickyi]|uniref:Transposase, IS605 OrfB family, central region n=1 Tax=Polynucleobacter kasalickyi TaxID=1938817 RepID=A0A1W2BEY2_9BURK|nr:IS200/IS605 family accessory protein TnpB-related protein [Polynucleobacter kasalickyi]SMC70908.1 transposase, IS605 OrfB family, central region [Polynucleobacter kasalickyi]